MTSDKVYCDVLMTIEEAVEMLTVLTELRKRLANTPSMLLCKP